MDNSISNIFQMAIKGSERLNVETLSGLRSLTQDCYHIGIDTAKNGDKSAVAVICKDCNTMLISEAFETDTALIIPKKCPHCEATKGGED